MTIDLQTYISPNENVFAREFDGEIVVLDLGAGVYYGLNQVASAAWKAMGEGKVLRDLATELLGQFEVDEQTLLNDLVSLATEWQTKGLVRSKT